MMTIAHTLSPMPSLLKRKQVRIYLDAEKQAQFEKLVERIGSMSESVVMTALVSSAVEACVEAGYRMPLPLNFQIEEGVPEKEKPLTKVRR
jgi:hypothetical protein